MTLRIAWTELKLLAREPLTMIVSMLFPLLLMMLLVGAFGNDPDPDMGGVGGVDFYVPVYAAATVAVLGFMGVPTQLAAYRERGVLRRFRAAGVLRGTVLRAQAIVMAVLALVGCAVMLGVGFAVYDLSAPAAPAGVVAGFALGTLAFAGIGVLLGSVLPTSRAAQGLGLLCFFGLFFIAGGGPPPALMPDTIDAIGRYSPMGPLVAAVRDPWHGAGWNVASLMALAAMAAVCWIAATRVRDRS
jgi:ABC-2 type transport system permease protein